MVKSEIQKKPNYSKIETKLLSAEEEQAIEEVKILLSGPITSKKTLKICV